MKFFLVLCKNSIYIDRLCWICNIFFSFINVLWDNFCLWDKRLKFSLKQKLFHKTWKKKTKNSVHYCLLWGKKTCSLTSTSPLFEYWFIVYSKKKKKARDTMTRGCRRVFTKKATCLTRTAHLSHLHLQVNFQFNNASKRPEKKRWTKSQKPFLYGMQGGAR